jgi:hypothetical protein
MRLETCQCMSFGIESQRRTHMRSSVAHETMSVPPWLKLIAVTGSKCAGIICRFSMPQREVSTPCDVPHTHCLAKLSRDQEIGPRIVIHAKDKSWCDLSIVLPWPPTKKGPSRHVRGTITDVAGGCPYTDDIAKVLGKGVKLLLWVIGRKAVGVG